jgi:Hemerythrin HHE cation binding domain
VEAGHARAFERSPRSIFRPSGAQPDEVVAFLKAQHNLIEDMFDEALHASDPQAREKPFVELRQRLAVHETAEEMEVHPRVRREADAGADAIAPTRPHAGVESAKLNFVVGPFASMLDRARDLIQQAVG